MKNVGKTIGFSNVKRICALGLLAIMAAGCNDYTTPKGVVETAAEAISTKNVKAFNRALTPFAQQKMGGKTGMSRLSGLFAGFTQLSVGDAEMVSIESAPAGTFLTEQRFYSVGIFTPQPYSDEDKRVATANVVCDVYALARSGQGGDCRLMGAPCRVAIANPGTEVSECAVFDLVLHF